MNASEIDLAIRKRLKELDAVLDMNKDIEYGTERTDMNYERDQLLCHYLPFVANSWCWDQVVEYVADLCDNPGGGCDGRPGRLYDLADWEILAAETWFSERKNWKEIVGDYDWDGDGDRGVVGAMVTINKEVLPVEVPVAVVYYISAAFSK